MTGLPKVSVAIVTYNQESFIRQTLDSVIAQDYENMEIIVSDDGSSDRTPEIIKEYADMYPGLLKIILSDNNTGIAENCNRAFFSCTGEYIAWLGGDDLFYPHKITHQVKAMEKNGECDLCFHAVRVFDSQSGVTIAITNTKEREKRNVRQLLYDGVSLPSSAIMVRRSSCPVNGFNVGIPRANDWLFYLESMLNGYVMRIDGVFSGYRMHNGNITRNSLIDDMHKTYEHIRYLRPDLTSFANRAEAIACYHEGRKLLNIGEHTKAQSIFLKGIKLSPLYFRLWTWFMFSGLGKHGIKTLKSSYQFMARLARKNPRHDI
ncbi:glycosyltransferase family 2 protein [Deinococcus humi]|uniref:Glycosyltransferase involved in cell wall biosynthesis n=1 Tax=Deinococcus humi TaxID=662880 RepID=A0A7W8NE46_9DEIO|nr:glycosyltransferase [Deinococcus humi]MBB5361423.1 glycosyltransferase involved in cell wall biosynthesis [Deinococcus humi]GGO20006.1 hypothetical protein GCM10008949_04850 [Deinococcus humi]